MTKKEFDEVCKELMGLLIGGFKGRCVDIYSFRGEHVGFGVWYSSKTGKVHFLLDGFVESVSIRFPGARCFRGTVLLLYTRPSIGAADNFLHRKKREVENYEKTLDIPYCL